MAHAQCGNNEAQEFKMPKILGILFLSSLTLAFVGCNKSPDEHHIYEEALKYYLGNEVIIDYERSARLATESAASGNLAAQTLLGEMYFYGRGVPRDYKKSKEWYLKAAEKGYPPAQVGISTLAADDEEKIKWLLPPAEQGYWPAQASLGSLYQTKGITATIGRQEHFDRAMKWFRLAAAQEKHPLFSIALMYQNAWGVNKDYSIAYALLTVASLEDEYAKELLGALKKQMNAMEIEDGISLAQKMINNDPLKELDRYQGK